MKFKTSIQIYVFKLVSGKFDKTSMLELPEGTYLVKEIEAIDQTGTWYQIMGKECVFCVNHNIFPKEKFFITQSTSALLVA